MHGQFDAAAPARLNLAEIFFQTPHAWKSPIARASDDARGAGEAAAFGDQHESTQQVRVEAVQGVMVIKDTDSTDQCNVRFRSV